MDAGGHVATAGPMSPGSIPSVGLHPIEAIVFGDGSGGRPDTEEGVGHVLGRGHVRVPGVHPLRGFRSKSAGVHAISWVGVAQQPLHS
jgi:hypothetical protein